MPKVAVIGGGACGLVSAKSAREAGFDCIVFESTKKLGGIWEVRNGLIYDFLYTNVSRDLMCFSDFPFASSVPHYPDHKETLFYLQSYVDHFDLERLIRYETTVEDMKQQTSTRWLLTIRDENTRALSQEEFDFVCIATNPYAAPLVPHIEGMGLYTGELMHSMEVRSAEIFGGKRVLVVGGGSSGADIALAVSQKNASEVTIALGSQVFVIPKMVKGQPFDHKRNRLRNLLVKLPYGERWLYPERAVLTALKKPNRNYCEYTSKDTYSSQLVAAVAFRQISIARRLLGFEGGKTCVFADGTRKDFDVVVLCTGYKRHMPFLRGLLSEEEIQNPSLYEIVFHPDLEGVAFIGNAKMRGAVWPVAEMQARWAMSVFSLQTPLPSKQTMKQHVAKQRKEFAAHGVGTHLLVKNRIEYMDRLAAKIGVRPMPSLLTMATPNFACQYRIRGPHSSPDATRHLLELNKDIIPTLTYFRAGLVIVLSLMAFAVVTWR